MGNAVYRDLIQALIMVQVDHLVLAVPNAYKYKTGKGNVISNDYSPTVAVRGNGGNMAKPMTYDVERFKELSRANVMAGSPLPLAKSRILIPETISPSRTIFSVRG